MPTSDPAIAAKGYANPDSLVSTEWLAAHLDDPSIRIIESDEDVLLYETGHIPGAFKVDWHTDLNDPLVRDYVSAEQFQATQLGDSLDAVRIVGIEQHRAGEFVAAEPRRQRRIGERAGHLDRDRAEQLVADRMAVHVVDRFEMVEIEHHQRGRLVPALGADDHRGPFFGEAAAIEESCQRVLRREDVGALLGGGTLGHFARQVRPDQTGPGGGFGLQSGDVEAAGRVVRDHPAGHRPLPGHVARALPDAVRALEADRRADHALRTDRLVAARAAYAGLPIRVPVAADRLVHENALPCHGALTR